MITFKITKHSTRDVEIVEVYDGDQLVGTITPGMPEDKVRNVRFISKFLYHGALWFEGDDAPVLFIGFVTDEEIRKRPGE